MNNAFLKICKQFLILELESKTNIDWKYLDANIPPKQEVKGGIKIGKIQERSLSDNPLTNDLSKVNIAIFQLRIILSTDKGENACEDSLLDWEELVYKTIKNLALQGLVNSEIHGQRILMGLKTTDRGSTLITEEIQIKQGNVDRLWKGNLYMEYSYAFERLYFEPAIF